MKTFTVEAYHKKTTFEKSLEVDVLTDSDVDSEYCGTTIL